MQSDGLPSRQVCFYILLAKMRNPSLNISLIDPDVFISLNDKIDMQESCKKAKYKQWWPYETI